jgi:RHS repeat-associated protein
LAGVYTYDPYGNLLSGPGYSGPTFRFDSAMYFVGPDKMGERYYDSTIGRWTQMDPSAGNLIDPQSLNRYAFVEGDPASMIDLQGLSVAAEWGVVAAGCSLGAFVSGASIVGNAGLSELFGACAVSASVGSAIAGLLSM